ncbi:uncharacterized protein LOC111462962 [Cucurbita moschata]|uniref:Uncharacterized protein LOC111462962 n=1 Tax=Cucurbita moschata TaxID=3662 RepID=A0A6J1HHG4_CUCMO|nr:uncharacterized protein LOC111462962 [Cucurbita moschata]
MSISISVKTRRRRIQIQNRSFILGLGFVGEFFVQELKNSRWVLMQMIQSKLLYIITKKKRKRIECCCFGMVEDDWLSSTLYFFCRRVYNIVDGDPARSGPREEVFSYSQDLVEKKWPDKVEPSPMQVEVSVIISRGGMGDKSV